MAIGLVVVIAACCGCEQTKSMSEVAFEEYFGERSDSAQTEFVYRNPLDNQQLAQVCTLSHLERLELYDASQLSADVLQSELQRLSRLKTLRLEQVAVGDDLMLNVICKFPHLEVLNLPDARFSDQALGEVSKLPRLTLLRFGSPDVTDDGVARLAKSPSLRFLHLLNVPVTDAGLAAFYELDQLESLYIDNGKETEDGIRELLKHNSGLHFHRNQLHISDDPNSDGH